MGREEYWTTVRVSKSTKAALERLRESMIASDANAIAPLDSEACMSGEHDKRDRIGLDRVIRRLIVDRKRWQRRRANSAERLRSTRTEPVN